VKRAIQALVPYLIAVVLLSSIDVTYEWLSPLPPGGESTTPTEWYAVVGLRGGALMLANHERPGPATGLSLDAHLPEFFLIPFIAAAGPEGGGIAISVWFMAVALSAVRLVWGATAKRWLRGSHIRG
jgi:hypothetical protein